MNVRDPDQVHRFFVWHRDNGTVRLLFPYDLSIFSPPVSVSYIDIYTLSVPSAGIASPGTTSFHTNNGDVNDVTTQSCSFSFSTNTLSRNTYTVSLTDILQLFIRFKFSSSDIDWLFRCNCVRELLHLSSCVVYHLLHYLSPTPHPVESQ